MNYLEHLNQPQSEAVRHTEGPLLILAGAGSGKTRVLTHRIAYLIDACGVRPWNILAITFTNKAAGEMRERVDRLVGYGADQVWVSTFHSSCARILRRFIDRIGYDANFTIYDTDDSRQAMKRVIKQLELNPKVYKERALLARISSAKNELISPDAFELEASRWEEKNVAAAYRAYQDMLHKNNALDFDDLLVKTVELFRADDEVLSYYQERFRYILIDEYQDTNTAQFAFVKLLASKYRNLCVVGDDDQSIYKFRGANIRNILNFEYEYPEAKVIRLEQNYRSTQMILDAANGVIANNESRKKKKLWTDLGEGKQITFRQFDNGYEEAEYIARDIRRKTEDEARPYSDFAVLYRTNAQSRILEEAFIGIDIPYKIVGGINFYARKEIKDILSYLKTIDNGADDLAVMRIVNVPKRGIGQTTIARVLAYADAHEISFYDALTRAGEIPGIGRAASKIEGFTNLISRFRELLDSHSILEVLDDIFSETGYREDLEAEGTPEAEARLENIDELRAKIADYEASAEQPGLSEFLQQVSLVADIDSVEEGSDYVLLMTMHAAKGLEFESVYLAGMEDGIFPGYMSISADDPSELEEERRLCYVGITRAKRELTLTAARQRMIRGETQYMKTSRFVREIPRELVSMDRDTEYRSRRQEKRTSAKKSAPFRMREFTVTKADHLDYEAGDRVRHKKFGEGIVQQIKDGGKDFEVTVDFEGYGIRRMFASFAGLEKI